MKNHTEQPEIITNEVNHLIWGVSHPKFKSVSGGFPDPLQIENVIPFL